MFDFADWLLLNRSAITNEDLLEQTEGISPLDDKIGGSLQKIWDNLFYQVTTQKSFELKEALSQLLIADNLIRKMSRTEGEQDIQDNNMLMQAKINLSSILFDDSEDLPSQQPIEIHTTPIIPDNFY